MTELTWPLAAPIDATRLLVCGGSGYQNRDRVFEVLTELNPAIVIHGAAPGADSFAHEWAIINPVGILRFPAKWGRYGAIEGFARNAKMLHEGNPTAVAAFPGGSGTEDMVRRALDAGVTVVRIRDCAGRPNPP